MKVFSTLLKIIKPKIIINIVKATLYETVIHENSPLPKKPYLKTSIMEDTGFKFISHLYLSGIEESG